MYYHSRTPDRGRYGRVLAIAAALSLLAFPAGNGAAVSDTGKASVSVAATPFSAAVPLSAANRQSGGDNETTGTLPHAPGRVALWSGPAESPDAAASPSGKAKEFINTPPGPLAMPDYGVFNSIAVPIGGLKIQQTWHRLIPDDAAIASLRSCAGAAPDQAIDSGNCHRGLLTMAKEAGISAAAPMSRETLSRVNRGINRLIAYGADSLVHNSPDHWASIDEITTLRRGDCEDFAIAKMWLLAAAGMPLEHMQLVVLHDTRRRLYHAVLVVHYQGERFVLDNTTDVMVSQDKIHDYLPLYSLSAKNAYIHGFPVTDPARVSRLAPLGEIYPGLGVEPEPQGAFGDDTAIASGAGIIL